MKRLSQTINIHLVDERCNPTQGSSGAAGWDARARIDQPVSLPAHSWRLVPLGIKLDLPTGWECQVRPRSGLAAKNGVSVLNSPGTVDEDYRGEVCAILINHSNDDLIINPFDRVAQLVFKEVPKVELVNITVLSESLRGEGGFGSTGTSGGKQ